MRTTVTLSSEAHAHIRKLMRERGLSFKDAVDAAILNESRRSAGSAGFSTPTFDLGRARMPLDGAIALAARLEDEELLRKRELGK